MESCHHKAKHCSFTLSFFQPTRGGKFPTCRIGPSTGHGTMESCHHGEWQLSGSRLRRYGTNIFIRSPVQGMRLDDSTSPASQPPIMPTVAAIARTRGNT